LDRRRLACCACRDGMAMATVNGNGNVQVQARIYLLAHSSLGRFADRLLLKHVMDVDVVAESDFRPTSVWKAMRSKPSVALVDSGSAQSDVVEAVQMITRLQPDIRVLVVSEAIEPAQVEAWGRCPMNGYVVKEAGVEEFRAAVEAIVHGRECYSTGMRENLNRGAARANGSAQLSPREAELLPLLARGMRLREAATTMTISYKTADSYRSSLLRKLNVRDRVELARYAIRRRIIEP
jgi:two-component system invasion response regulator UvrY